MMDLKIVVFLLATFAMIYVSRHSLRSARSHGFYRLLAWESILALALINLDHWFADPFRPWQLVSWILLLISLYLVIQGVRLLRQEGKPDEGRQDATLLGIEKTSNLVTIGLYRYIRHPLYSSLLFLTWGIFFKLPSWLGAGLAGAATIFLFLTAKAEERENIRYFGDAYQVYMRKTKMFIPFLF